MLIGHGGNRQKLAQDLGCTIDDIIDMSSNLNPLGPPDFIAPLIKEKIHVIESLPPADAHGMRLKFARHHQIDDTRVAAGNGTTWFIYTIPKALNIKKAVIVGPTYSDYEDACRMNQTQTSFLGAEPQREFVPDMESVSTLAGFADLVFICNPNNPTGALIDKEIISGLIQKHPQTLFVIDESYLPFLPDADELSFVKEARYDNLIVLSSMSKIFRIPGLRTGFITASSKITSKIMAHYQPWSVNAVAQTVIEYIFDHPEIIEPFYKRTREYTAAEKDHFLNKMASCPGLKLFEGHAYFILAQLAGSHVAPDVCQKVGQERILIRDCSNFQGLSEKFIRFSLKKREENDALAGVLKKVLSDG